MVSSSPSTRRASAQDDSYSDKDVQQRFEKLGRSALNTPPKPLKSMTPKRPKTQRKKGGKKD